MDESKRAAFLHEIDRLSRSRTVLTVCRRRRRLHQVDDLLKRLLGSHGPVGDRCRGGRQSRVGRHLLLLIPTQEMHSQESRGAD